MLKLCTLGELLQWIIHPKLAKVSIMLSYFSMIVLNKNKNLESSDCHH